MNDKVTVPLTHDELIINSYRATRREAGDLEKLIEALQHSETNVKNTAYNKLQVIADQIKFLQRQANDILSNAKNDAELHKISCNFIKKPGQIYHLYERSNGDKFWSMISAEEFGLNCPNEHIGSFRMESDSSFTNVSQLQEHSQSRNFAETLMKQGNDLPAINFISNVANS